MINLITRSTALIAVLGFLFGCSLINQSDDLNAAKTLNEQRNTNEALISAQRAINADPTNYEAHFLKGEIIYQLSKSYIPAERKPLYIDMVNAFDAAILNAPALETETLAQQASNYIDSAFEFEFQNANNILSGTGEDNGDAAISNAIVHLENAAVIEKSNTEVYEMLFDLYIASGDMTKAAKQLNNLSSYTTLSLQQHEILGFMMYEQGNFPLARTHLEEAWQNGQGSVNAARGLVNTYNSLEMEDEALDLVMQLVEVDSNDITVLLAYANILITKTMDSLDEVSISRTNDLAALQYNVAKLNKDEATENLNNALGINPQDLKANYLKGYFLMKLGYWYDSIPTSQPGLYSTSQAADLSNDFFYQSVNHLETVVEQDDSFRDAWLILSSVYEQLGMTEEAQRARQRISS